MKSKMWMVASNYLKNYGFLLPKCANSLEHVEISPKYDDVHPKMLILGDFRWFSPKVQG